MDAAIQTPRRKSAAKVLQMAGGMVVGAAFGAGITFFGMDALDRLDLGPLATLALAAAVVMSFPLLVGVHELGHLLGGMAAGFRPLLFMVGPLRVEREGERFRTKLSFKGALFGGLAACVPTDTHDLRRRTLWLIAGGPLASLAAGGLLLGVRAAADAPPLAETLLLITGAVSLLICAVSAIPTTAAGFYSDGARIIRLVRGGADVERGLAALWLDGARLAA